MLPCVLQTRLVGATTFEEYKIIEKDSAMERRLKPILIEEPTTERAIFILKKLRPMFESHHNIKISEEAIMAAVMLSHKYVKHRRLPDKAIDLVRSRTQVWANCSLDPAHGTSHRESVRASSTLGLPVRIVGAQGFKVPVQISRHTLSIVAKSWLFLQG